MGRQTTLGSGSSPIANLIYALSKPLKFFGPQLISNDMPPALALYRVTEGGKRRYWIGKCLEIQKAYMVAAGPSRAV